MLKKKKFPSLLLLCNPFKLILILELFSCVSLTLPFPSTSSFPQNPFCLSCIEINKLADLQLPDSQTGLIDPCVFMNLMEKKKERPKACGTSLWESLP